MRTTSEIHAERQAFSKDLEKRLEDKSIDIVTRLGYLEKIEALNEEYNLAAEYELNEIKNI
tara:strand:+ start:710 stop:892 length:183 start_codon:yes stop_codon:yes gene_type:complete